MRNSTTSPQIRDARDKKDQKPCVQRIGPPLSPICILFIVTLVFLAGVVALTSSGCTTQSATDTRENTFDVGESPTLTVNTLGGRIEVNVGSDNVINVRTELRDIRRIEYKAEKHGNEVSVTADKTNDWWFPAGNTRADIYVTVPADTDLTLKTSNGEIKVQGTTAGGTLETSNGAIILEDVKGNFEAKTSNGPVEINTIEGSASVETSNGKVTLREAEGQFKVATSNGDVSFSGEMTAKGDNRLVTSNGHVEVELLGIPSISVDASTSNGEIRHPDVPILTTMAKTDHVVGTIGNGEAYLYIKTSNGDVIIE